MKKRFAAMMAAVLTSAATLLVLFCVLSGSGLGTFGTAGAGSLGVHSSYGGHDRAPASDSGVSYYLDAFDHPSDFRNNYRRQGRLVL